MIKETILTNNPCYKQGRKITVKGLMLHSVGCAQPSAAVFVKNWNRADYDRACVHGFIDGNDGTVYQTLPWDHRGWHAGGVANNTHIGVEMCEPACIKYTKGATFTCSDVPAAQAVAIRTYNAAVELFAMLCQKFNLDPLADGVILSHAEGAKRGIAANHSDPEHLWRQLSLPYSMDTFRAAVKEQMTGSAPAMPAAPVANGKDMSEEEIYTFFKSQGMTDEGVSGLMGNLYAESGLKSTNLQNSFERSLGMDDATYTAAVDSLIYGNFVRDKAGYGLAQWTYWSRKQALLEFAILKGTSIGDCHMQCEFLMKELKEKYVSVLAVLKKTKSVKEASDIVLNQYERPADQSESVKAKRASYGQRIYENHVGGVNVSAIFTEPFRVKVNTKYLNIRKGPGMNFETTGKCTGIGVFTIVELQPGPGASTWWGRLKSGAGWICMDYVQRL